MNLVVRHDFNSRWWGKPVGITHSSDVLTMSRSELDELCFGFDWVEARIANGQQSLSRVGVEPPFVWSDLQLGYSVKLKRVPKVPEDWTWRTADQQPIDPDDFSEFSSDRYLQLPNATPQMISSRYRLWANDLITKSPRQCATVYKSGNPEGYIFGDLQDNSAKFTLAVSSRRGKAPGLGIYLTAAQFFRELGATSMYSSFSAGNLSALNVHSSLNCQFVEAVSIWFFLPQNFDA